MARLVDFVLTDDERETLERWARRPKSAQALALRCRIVLAAAAGESSKDIARRLGCTGSTVGRWRGRFAAQRLDGLHDEPRPGKPRRIIGDDDVERVIVTTLEQTPADATHWSTRSMAKATGMDEKSQIQALDRTAPILALIPGTPERRTHDYKRNGTTNLYASLDVASGKVIADLTPRHRAEEFRRS